MLIAWTQQAAPPADWAVLPADHHAIDHHRAMRDVPLHASTNQLQEAVFKLFAGGNLVHRAGRAHHAVVNHSHMRAHLLDQCHHMRGMITVPPVCAYSARMSLRLALDTGSTDSNGSSNTRMRGL